MIQRVIGILKIQPLKFCNANRLIYLPTIDFAVSALNRPVVVAVIVNGAFAIEQQTIFASLQCQSSVGAEEELIAHFGVCIGMFTVRIGA